MNDAAPSTNNPISTQGAVRESTVAKIKSSTWLWIGRAVYGAMLIAAIVYIGQMTLVAKDYFSQIAAAQLPGDGLQATLFVWGSVIIRLAVHTIFILTSIFIFVRRSQDRLGMLMAITAVMFGAGSIGFPITVPNLTPFLAEHNLTWGYYLLSPLGWVLAQMTWLLFPDGRFAPPRMRYALIICVPLVLLWAFPSDSPLFPFNWSPWVYLLVQVPLGTALTYSTVYRYRYGSTPVQRQQIKWYSYGIGLGFWLYSTVFVVRAIFPASFPMGGVAFHLLFLLGQASMIWYPVAFFIAITRYRLWDIDLVINRSLVYGTVGIVIALNFVMVLLGLQLVTGEIQPVAVVVVSVLLSALIFTPLRNRAQHLIDHYVYHLRFDLNEVHEAQKLPEIKNPGALSGQRLGEYQVGDLIGKGGMGEVYRAVCNGETVAIKTLLSEKTADDALLQRFEREAKAGMTINHPNVAHVRSIARQDSLVYMVMDYLDGQDLHAMLKQKGKLDSQTVIAIVTKLADALGAVHDSGMVHRDIKPSNVMLIGKGQDETYRVVLMDFGVTKMKDAQSLTGTEVIGTIDYMAPEQILSAAEVDHRADIYALGIMMYEMLVGERPFSGNVGQVLFAHIQQPAPDPRIVDANLPHPLVKAVLKALEKSPDKRFQSVHELSQSLQ